MQSAYNKVEQTEQMVAVSRELLAARKEAHRISERGLIEGTQLRSQAQGAIAQESEAQTALLQAQFEFVQAQDELYEAVGRNPRP